ncbi:Transposable element P transposase [Amphibalanus amphitrite]|uniref:Transposable element P transposase n=1 Tax=Amphibalanus amphitrite TaxID=1232801 RepID=A0A6A4W1U4_AMPAM|nr:Transposable element P transposase [Amphibalanus amphitrite]
MFGFRVIECHGCTKLQAEKDALEAEKTILQNEKKELQQQLLAIQDKLHDLTLAKEASRSAIKTGLFTEQQRYLATFVLQPDSSATQLELLAKMVQNLTRQERQCVVMYDEMDIRKVACYDQQLDQVLGPHRRLQQFLVAGIFSKWQVPVLFQFDSAVTVATLLSLIQGIEAAGAEVVATVSDMGGSNLGVWKALGVSHDGRSWFLNPGDSNRRVWVLADPPHIMKRVRNNLLDHGIRTSQGGLLDKALMEEMVAINGASAEYRVAHKVHLATHVQVKNMARQKVRPAMELLSATVALAIERHLGRREEVRALRVLDSGMDVLNAIHPKDVKPLRRGYSGTTEQESALTALEKEARELRVCPRKDALLPFQKGIILSVSSVRGLLQDLKAKFGEQTYLLTRRLSQDRLEGFFGMVRSGGGSNLNPTPTEVRSRLRLLTLLFAIQRGVRPLSGAGPTAPAPAVPSSGEEADDRDPDWLAQLAPLEQELSQSALDDEMAADLREFAPSQHQPEADDNLEAELAEMEELLRSVPAPAAAPPASGAVTGARDLETGVSARDSAKVYVAGYVSRKRSAEDGAAAASSGAEQDEPMGALWTRLKSLGGLTVPTADFMDVFDQMDAAFSVHHCMEPDGLSRRPGVVRDFEAVLESKFRYATSPQVRRVFARVRTFIELQRLNTKHRARVSSDAQREGRKRRQYVPS